ATFRLEVKVNADVPQGTTVTNTVTVSSPTSDPNTQNNSDTETTTVNAQADLSVVKTTSGEIAPGENLTYTLTVANAGPSDAQSVTLSDLIPANTTFVSATQTAGPSFTLAAPPVGGSGAVTATIATLAAGASATFQIVVLVDSGVSDGTTI